MLTVGTEMEIVDAQAKIECPSRFVAAESLPGAYRRVANAAKKMPPEIPAYLEDTYHWAYLNPRSVRWLDRESVVRTILWQQHVRLRSAAFQEIEPGSSVLQPACVYGDFSSALAEHIGPDGSLEVLDVARIQVANCRRKLKKYPQASVRHANAMEVGSKKYAVVCCYFLMHELPDDIKHLVADALLLSVAPGGKLIFVDYHKPHWAHPLKPITSLVFDMLEPFAKGLWHKELSDFASDFASFAWKKETFFGGLFQKVVASRPNSATEESVRPIQKNRWL